MPVKTSEKWKRSDKKWQMELGWQGQILEKNKKKDKGAKGNNHPIREVKGGRMPVSLAAMTSELWNISLIILSVSTWFKGLTGQQELAALNPFPSPSKCPLPCFIFSFHQCHASYKQFVLGFVLPGTLRKLLEQPALPGKWCKPGRDDTCF